MQRLCYKREAEGSHRQGLAPGPEPLKESVGRGRTMRISRGPQSGELVKNTDTWAPPRPAGSEAQSVGPGESIFPSSPGELMQLVCGTMFRGHSLRGHWDLCL